MSWKRTIFTGIIFVLMVMAYFLNNTIIARHIIQTVRDRSLTDSVNVSDVGQIYLENPQGKIKLVKTSTGWQIKEPMDVPADPEVVQTVLINVTSAQRKNENEAKNLAEFGLAHPEIELTLVAEDGKSFGDHGTSFGLQLGHESTYTGQVFAKFPDSKDVFTVGEHVKNTLLRSPMDFRRSRIFNVDTGELEQYTAFQEKSADGKGFTLSNQAGVWKIAEPTDEKAEQTVVREYLNKLGLLRASSFLTQNSDKPTSMAAALQALTSPTLTVTLQGAANTKPQQLVVALADGVSGTVYVAQHPGDQEIMVLSSETMEDLRREAHYFRSRQLFDLNPDDVSLFTIQIGRAPATALIRDEKTNSWQLVGDPEFRVDQNAVTDRLNALLDLKIKDYTGNQAGEEGLYGLDVPRVKFTVTNKAKNNTELLEVGKGEPGNVGTSYARTGKNKDVFTVQLSADLFVLAAQIADKHFAAVDLKKLQRMEIDVDKKTYELKLEKGEWKLLRPEQTTYATADVRKVNSFLGLLFGLEYQEDVSASGNTIIAPKQGPPLAIRYYGEKDLPLGEVNVTKRINSEITLITNGRGRVFEVRSSDVDRLYNTAQTLVD